MEVLFQTAYLNFLYLNCVRYYKANSKYAPTMTSSPEQFARSSDWTAADFLTDVIWTNQTLDEI